MTMSLKPNSFQRLSVLLLLLFSLQANATDQWYQVELIVFEQENNITDEQWPEMLEQEIAPLTPDMSDNLIQPAANETLASAAYRLERSPNYQVLYYRAWQQPILEKSAAKAVSIQASEQLVDGALRLYKSTYLHAQLSVWLKKNIPSVNSWSDVTPEGTALELPRNPHLAESRRIKSKKLYYFDHPVLGALLQLTPVETPAAVEANSDPLQTYSLPSEAAANVSQ